MNSLVLLSKSAYSPPDLSSNTISKPALLPKPGTLGGWKNTTFASGTFPEIPNSFLVISSEVCPSFFFLQKVSV
jgi:hypothetical protein